MGITSGQLAELKRIAENADGMKSDDWSYYPVFNEAQNKDEYVVADFSNSGCGYVCTASEEEISDYIAAARPQVVLALIAEIERLRAIAGESD